MMILTVTKKTKTAHILVDGKTLCGATFRKGMQTGQSMGILQATRKCEACGPENWRLYFEELRRNNSYEASKHAYLAGKAV